MSAQGVFTRNKRFEFVKGWLTGGTDPLDGSVECGDYTGFPIEVTGATMNEKLDKVAEIYYRVKYARFTENTLSSPGSWTGGVVDSGLLSPRIQSEPAIAYANFLANGYWALDEVTFPCYADAIPYLTDQYNSNIYDPWFSVTDLDFRDIGDNERGMWLPDSDGESPKWNKVAESNGLGIFYSGGGSYAGFDEQYFRTAFSWHSIGDGLSATPPPLPIPYITDDAYLPELFYESLEILVEFNGQVAIVGDMDDFYNPSNRVFIGVWMRFLVTGAGISATTGDISNGYSSTTATYTMRLSSGDLSCPIGCIGAALTGGIVHEATEWWPYAKGSPSTAVWESSTGARL